VHRHRQARPRPRRPLLPESSDSLHLWIDTRDTRDVHRATRYCHRYIALLEPGIGKSLSVGVGLRKIHRAASDPPTSVRPSSVLSRAERNADGYRLELFLPAAALHGFEPETNRRLGFHAMAVDPERGEHHTTIGRDFPVADDPSLWATLELVDTHPA
jgi:hypothetical protein